MAPGTLIASMMAFALAASGATANAEPPSPTAVSRSSQLVGVGLVVGLPQTGDTFAKSPFTVQMLKAVLARIGSPDLDPVIYAGRLASVMVVARATLPISPTDAVDADVATIGDATSIQGGALLMTRLAGADGKTYAIGQGAVVQGCGKGRAAPTTGCIPHGAVIVRLSSAKPILP